MIGCDYGQENSIFFPEIEVLACRKLLLPCFSFCSCKGEDDKMQKKATRRNLPDVLTSLPSVPVFIVCSC